MNKFANKKIGLALKVSLAISSVVASAFLLSPRIENIQINKNKIISISENQNINNKSLNESQTLALTNSQFFFSEFELMNAVSVNFADNYDREAVKQWETIKSNLEIPEIKAFENTASYKYIMNKVVELLGTVNPNLTTKEALKNDEATWNLIKDSLGWKEFSDIVGSPEEFKKNLSILSGFVSGNSDTHRIQSILNRPDMSWIDLSKNESDPTYKTAIPPLSGDYKTVVKIAQFDPTSFEGETGTIKIDFSFIMGEGISSMNGSLILRELQNLNDTNDLQQSMKNLNIFGRWNTEKSISDSENVEGSNQVPGIMNNFVLSRNPINGNISIFVRLKENQNLNQIVVKRDFGHTGIANFGIIESQLNDESPIFNENISLSGIQFFSSALKETNATPKDVEDSANQSINSKFEYYLGDNTSLNLNLFYKKLALSENEKPIYKELYDFVGDEVSTILQQSLQLGIKDNSPLSIGSKKILFSKSVLEEVVKSLDANITNGSISIQTYENGVSLEPKPTLFKQQLFFNDEIFGFAIKGDPTFVASNTLGIKIEDVSQKIFFEKPKSFENSSDLSIKPVFSESLGSKWVNEESEVISKLAEVYSSWANNGVSGGFLELGENKYNKIAYTLNNNEYSEIKWVEQKANYTGNQLYISLVGEYESYTKILNQLIPNYNNDENIFKIPQNSPTEVIENRLLSLENGDVRTAVITAVKEIITNKPEDEIAQVEKQLLKLVIYKFSEMKKTVFDEVVNNYYYEEIKKYLISDINSKTFNLTNDFLNFVDVDELFLITSDKILTSSQSIKGSKVMESLFNLLYYGSEVKKMFFGTSIFSTPSPSSGNESAIEIFNKYSNVNDRDQLSTFESTTSQSKTESMSIYDKLFSIFGFSINGITDNSLKSGEKINLSWKNDKGNTLTLDLAISNVLEQFVSKKSVDILQESYQYSLFNSLVTSANIYNSLKYRFDNSPFAGDVENAEANVKKDKENIRKILAGGINSPEQLFAWSRVQMSANVSNYIEKFSADINQAQKFSNQIKTDKDILERIIEEQTALLQVNPLISVGYVWPVMIGLISVGMIVVSAISLAGITKTSKLSSRKVISAIIIITLILSILLFATAGFGLFSTIGII